jgi:hypothetical protein
MRQTPLVDPGADVLSVAEGQADIPIALAEVAFYHFRPPADRHPEGEHLLRTDLAERDPEPRGSSARSLVL